MYNQSLRFQVSITSNDTERSYQHSNKILKDTHTYAYIQSNFLPNWIQRHLPNWMVGKSLWKVQSIVLTETLTGRSLY